MKPAQGTPTLDPVEATGPATDLCTGLAPRDGARARILAWLAEGAREVTWALCSLPRERWAEVPPPRLSDWPALRHVQHVALRETHQTLPALRRALGEETHAPDGAVLSALEWEEPGGDWDRAAALESAETIVRTLGETRFELLQRLEAAPEDPELDWLVLGAHQHELQHLAAIWRIALHWDRVSRAPVPGVPLHPADRLEESH